MPINQKLALQNFLLKYKQYKKKGQSTIQENAARSKEEQERIRREAEQARQA